MTRRRKLSEPQAWRECARLFAAPSNVWPVFLSAVEVLSVSGCITDAMSKRMMARYAAHLRRETHMQWDTMAELRLGRSLAALFLAIESTEDTRGRAR